ncbi:NADP-dependent oxidoreductase [Kocuria palustris]|uniref:NADP-dependent oxidoreductase n=1 Tax=Kocuria palustris TaxID=71999 RepID=UPI0011A5AFD3|nr:NADP-dependent oxidoreductase [Kocuria palustris]
MSIPTVKELADSARSTRWELLNRPSGWPTQDDVRKVTVDLPELSDGEVRVVNEAISVDPYMRGRMDEGPSYVPAFELGEPMDGAAVGIVVASRSDDVPEGTRVLHGQGWRDVAQLPAEQVQALPDLRDPDGPLAPSRFLGIAGMPGFTAWLGLTRIAAMQEGDVVFVSGAAGTVGSAVGQIARLKGAPRVIGSAGGQEKNRIVTERYGFDACLDYKQGDVMGQLGEAAPDGIDVYFDNVGGDHLEAAIQHFNDDGRAALCGAISQYNDEEPAPGPRNMGMMVTKRLMLQGFVQGFHSDAMPEFLEEMGGWLAEGRIVADETVEDGIDQAFDSFLGMMQGRNVGKMVVRTAVAD